MRALVRRHRISAAAMLALGALIPVSGLRAQEPEAPVGEADTPAAAEAGAAARATDAAAALARRDTTDVTASAVSLSSSAASLELVLADGARRTYALDDGELRIDGMTVESYPEDGALEASWRELLRSPAVLDPARVEAALLAWAGSDLPSGGPAAEALADGIERALVPAPAIPDAAARAEAVEDGESRVTIAPGNLSFDALAGSLERLGSSLARIGDEAAEADEDLALVVHDSYAIPAGRTINGNLALLDGELRLGGTIAGDVLMLDGRLLLEPTARVEGDVLQVGGDVVRRGGRVEGELVSLGALADLPAGPAMAPRAQRDRDHDHSREVRNVGRGDGGGFFSDVASNIGDMIGGLVATIAVFLFLGLAGAGLVYFARSRFELVADTIRGSPARSFGIGVAAELLFIPVLVVLCVAILTWIVVPVYLVGFGLATVGGYLAAAHALGETVSRRRERWVDRLRLRHSNSFGYVLSGVAVLLAPLAIVALLELFGGFLGFLQGLACFLFVLATWVAVSAGLGAVVLSRGGSRAEYARPAMYEETGDLFVDTETYGRPGRGGAPPPPPPPPPPESAAGDGEPGDTNDA